MSRFLLVASLLLAASAWSQDALTAKVEQSGTVRVFSGTAELAMVELNAHGAQWKHAPQATASATVTDLPGGAGKRVVGTLPIPNTEGALRFTQTVKPIPQGLQFDYEVSVGQSVRVSGLQVSVNLPAARYAGKELLISRPDAEPDLGTLPTLASDQLFQIYSGEGERVEVAKKTPDVVAAQLRAVTDILVQDLRRWQHDVFEIRFPAIMEDGGRDLTPDDRFHLDFTLTFAGPVKITGP
jgi:hypothetical protein